MTQLERYAPTLVQPDRSGVVWKDPVVLETHGHYLIVAAPYRMNRDRPEIVGTSIERDGKLYRVVGCERFMPATPIAQGERIGLLVELQS